MKIINRDIDSGTSFDWGKTSFDYARFRDIYLKGFYQRIREIRKNEYPILSDFLYEAIFIPEGMDKPPKSIIEQPELQVYSIIEQPELQVYIEGFGKADDWCFVVEIKEKIVGVAWVRIMDDYGHIDGETPSFAISLYEIQEFGHWYSAYGSYVAILERRRIQADIAFRAEGKLYSSYVSESRF